MAASKKMVPPVVLSHQAESIPDIFVEQPSDAQREVEAEKYWRDVAACPCERC